MHDKFLSEDQNRSLVYIKEITPDDLPPSVNLDAIDGERVFAVHDAHGAQLAVAANRELAFHLARANDLVPMTVH